MRTILSSNARSLDTENPELKRLGFLFAFLLRQVLTSVQGFGLARREKRGDLPVLQSIKFQFLINLQTAKTLGIDVPLAALSLADELIE